MQEFIKICKLSELPNKRGKKFQLDDDSEIAVFKIGDRVYAAENTCPHNHSHVMDEGFIDDNLNLACPIHGWQFNLLTGEVPPNDEGFSGKLNVFNTKVESGDVYIEKKKFKFFNW
jgi:NAD(P)H-dependent nitrite reductase small subunit